MINKSTRNVIQLLIITIVGIFVIVKGAIYYPDSYAFLDMRFNRSPLYATFLKCITTIFGSYYEIAAISIQYIIIALASNTFVKGISNRFRLSIFYQIVLLLIVLSPVLHWHYTANKLLSESLAYPFLLWTLWFAFKYLLKFRFKDLIKLTVFLCLLLLTRGQFIAVALGILLILAVRTVQERKTEKLILVFGGFALAVVVANLSERTYNNVVHGIFIKNQMSYVHLVAADFYVSKASDAKLFKDATAKRYFQRVHKSLEEKRLTRDIVLSDTLDDQQQYQWNFVEICNRTVQEKGLALFKEKGLESYQQHIELNTLCKSMFFTLFKANFSSRLKLIYKNYKTTFGTAKYLLLFVIIFVITLSLYLKKDEPFYLFILSMTFLMLINNFVIAVVVHPINRYTFYFDWLPFAIILLLTHYAANRYRN